MSILRNWRVCVVIVVLGIAVGVDSLQWRTQAMQQSTEQLYLHSYPARKLYARYIQPALSADNQYPLNRLRILDEPAGALKQSRSAAYAVALLDMRDGEVVLEFPAQPLFEEASFSIVGWDGLAIAGGEAQGRQMVPAGDFSSSFLFVRLAVDPAEMNRDAVRQALDAVRVGSMTQGYYDFSAANCQAAPPQGTWFQCTDTLLSTINAAGAFAESLNEYREQADVDQASSLLRARNEAEKSLVMALRHSIGHLTGNRWWVYRDFFRLHAGVVDPLLTRAAFWAAPFLPIPDSKIKIAVNMDDDTGQYLSGGDAVYKLVFDTAQLSPETIDWSFSVYERDKPEIWVAEKTAVLRKDNAVLAADGSLTLYLSQQRPAHIDEASWLPIPAGHFVVVYRGHTRLPLDRYDDFAALSRLERVPLAAE